MKFNNKIRSATTSSLIVMTLLFASVASGELPALLSEVNFEEGEGDVFEPAGCAGLFVAWGEDACPHRNYVPTARKRVSLWDYEGACSVSNKQARRGDYSALCEAALYGASNGKRVFALARNNFESTYGKLEIGQVYWLGFSLFIESEAAPPSWELYLQFHNNAKEPGWTSTMNPQVALERSLVDPKRFNLAWRYNELGEESTSAIYQSASIGEVVTGGWMDFVIRVKISTASDTEVRADGLLEVYQRLPDGELNNIFERNNIRIGYGRPGRDQQDYGPEVGFGIYNGGVDGEPTTNLGRVVYVDEIRLGTEPVFNLGDVDPEGPIGPPTNISIR